ncbi:transposase domain-containing protein [Ferrimicrobium acidiphilum]|uniref:transposase domain-containing protein n=1 Tax=Ferrimicrobium acidiphilum TaxID=121039 RepID=UPI003C6D1996
MPRSGWVKPATDRRLSDLVSIGLLTRVFPPDVIDAAIDDVGRRVIRNRVLPARGWSTLPSAWRCTQRVPMRMSSPNSLMACHGPRVGLSR